MQKSGYVVISILLVIISISSVSLGYIGGDAYASDPDLKQVTIVMNSGGVYLPVENQAVTQPAVRSDLIVEKPATANLSGTIDGNNSVILEGLITLDGQKENVKLSGRATRGLVGWSVSEGDVYAAKMDLKDENNRFFLQGAFLDDGHGRLFGTVLVDRKECTILLYGNSTDMYENVNPVNNAQIDHLEVKY